jgi:MarR family transcriptional regulator, organic hydroperoxide resistance regulator
MRAAEQLRYLALGAQREGNRWLANELRPLGLTPSQAEVLRVLGDAAPLSLSTLGELLVCESGTNPSRLVDRLVAAGLVERRPLETDRRAVVLTLTAKGEKLERRVRSIEDAMYAELDQAGSPAEVATAIEFLQLFVVGRPSGDALAARIAIVKS